MKHWRTLLRTAALWAAAWSMGTLLWQLLKSLLLVGWDVLASQFIPFVLYGLLLHAVFGAVAGAAFAILLHRFEPDRANVGLPLGRAVLWGALAGWLVSPAYFTVVMLHGELPFEHLVRTMIRFGATTAATGAIVALAQWRFVWNAVSLPGRDPPGLEQEEDAALESPGLRHDALPEVHPRARPDVNAPPQ